MVDATISAPPTTGAAREATRAAVILTAATGFTALGNLLVHVFVARAAGVDTYGGVGALLSLGVVAASVAAGIQYAVTRRAAVSRARNGALILDGMFAASPWLALLVAGAAASPLLAAFLRFDGVVPVLLAIGYCAALIIYAIPAGILVGHRRIGTFAWLTVATTALRIGYGFLFGWNGSSGVGALASSALSVLTVAVMAVIALALHGGVDASGDRTSRPLRARLAVTAEGATGAVLSALLWATWTAPVLAARHFLSPRNAGDFAAAQLMATAILFLTAGLATAFYPMIARTRRLREATIGLAATVGLAAAGALVATVAGPAVVAHLYGGRFGSSTTVFLTLGISVTALAAGTYVLWAVQALQRQVLPMAMGIVAAFVTEVALGLGWHASLARIALGPAVATATGAVAATVVMVARARFRRPHPVVRLPYVMRPAPAVDAGHLLASTAVGVMVHNEAAMIGPVLSAILSQTDGTDRVARVVVIASACTDATEDVVRAMADRDPRVQLLSQSTREGKASAINLFISTTSEPICALVGGDTLLAPDALAALVAPFADGCVGMTGARVVPTNLRRGVAARLVHVLWDLHHEAAMRRPKLGEAVAFRRGVDHIDATSLTDEVSLEAAVLATGRTLRYVPEAVVFNHGADSVHDYLAHRRRIHRGHLGVQHATGYSPSTLDRSVVLGATLSVLRRRPLSAPALAAAAVLEGVARSQAWRAHRLALDADNGVWEPIRSAKRPFEIEYQQVEVVGHVSRSAADAPAPDQGRILSGTSG